MENACILNIYLLACVILAHKRSRASCRRARFFAFVISFVFTPCYLRPTLRVPLAANSRETRGRIKSRASRKITKREKQAFSQPFLPFNIRGYEYDEQSKNRLNSEKAVILIKDQNSKQNCLDRK